MAPALPDLGTALDLPEVAARSRVGVQTVRKWIRAGVSIAGRRVKLEALRVGGRVRVTEAALSRFVEACNPGAVASESPAATSRRLQRERDALLKQLSGGRS